jgi:hypothetical protein
VQQAVILAQAQTVMPLARERAAVEEEVAAALLVPAQAAPARVPQAPEEVAAQLVQGLAAGRLVPVRALAQA